MKKMKMKNFVYEGDEKFIEDNLESAEYNCFCADTGQIVAFNKAIKVLKDAGYKEAKNYWGDEGILNCLAKVSFLEVLIESSDLLIKGTKNNSKIEIRKINVNDKDYYLIIVDDYGYVCKEIDCWLDFPIAEDVEGYCNAVYKKFLEENKVLEKLERTEK